jgi:hypothetical protein
MTRVILDDGPYLERADGLIEARQGDIDGAILYRGKSADAVHLRKRPDLVTAIMRGDIDVGFDFFAAFRPTIEGKQLKIIATSGEHPNAAPPGVPTVKDSGYPEYLPYGMAANRPSIDALVTYALQQKLIPSRQQLDQVSVDIDP